MNAPDESTQARSRFPRRLGVALALLAGVLLAGRALHAVRHNARLWSGLRSFAQAFGGVIGIALLLAAAVAVLFLVDSLVFREHDRGRDSDAD